MTTSALNLAASPPRRTPLYDRHLALGGRMVDFGGWELPQQYTSIRDEHFAVRKVAGLFDISHMGRLLVEGAGAEGYLQHLLTNDVSALAPGRAIYSLMCQEDGGAIDDLVVYREAADRFLVVVNAANREKDTSWMRGHTSAGVSMTDHTEDMSLIAFQGPRAHALLPRDSSPTDDIPYFGFRPGKVAGVAALESITLLAASAKNLAVRCVDGLQATDRGPELVERSPMLATALTPVIGYDETAKIAKESMRTGRSIRQLARTKGVPEATLNKLLNLAKMTKPGLEGPGGGG